MDIPVIIKEDLELGKEIWAQIVSYKEIYTPQSGATGIAKIIAEKRFIKEQTNAMNNAIKKFKPDYCHYGIETSKQCTPLRADECHFGGKCGKWNPEK